MYMGFLIAIIFGELFITFLLLLKQSHIEKFLTDSVDAIISMYGVNATQSTWSLLDRVQQSGCEEKLKDWFEKNVFVIVGMSLALLFIQILQFILGLSICRNIVPKIRHKQPENLLDEMDENPASRSEPQQNDVDYHQDYRHQPMHNVYNQGQGEYQDPGPQPQHRHDIHAYEPRQKDEYDDVGQTSQMYQHHRGPVHNRYVYNQRPEDGSTEQYNDATYDRFQEQQYRYERDLQHRQSYNGNYNRGYDHDDGITY
ncbi:hypothetical protein QTP86_002972 [Hemibagrus guttatus]|nr:hypothetical protein QTP86_002972 [Hemibagrus guttatus]